MKNRFTIYHDDQPNEVADKIESILKDFGITFKDVSPDGAEFMEFEIVKEDDDKGYIVSLGHDSSYEKGTFVKRYDQAVNKVHEFFLSYDFEIRDGKPFDPGNDDGGKGGFEIFGDGPEDHEYPDWKVIEHDGELKVIKFIHCDGDGPVGSIRPNGDEEQD
jgi:hypothetical protein